MSRITTREPEPFTRKLIEIRRLNFFVPVTMQITVTEVIGENHDNIGPLGGGEVVSRIEKRHSKNAGERDTQEHEYGCFLGLRTTDRHG